MAIIIIIFFFFVSSTLQSQPIIIDSGRYGILYVLFKRRVFRDDPENVFVYVSSRQIMIIYTRLMNARALETLEQMTKTIIVRARFSSRLCVLRV